MDTPSVVSSEQGSDSLQELLQYAYSQRKNHQGKNYLAWADARSIVTRARLEIWINTHPVCQEHGHECFEKQKIIDLILETRWCLSVFIVLMFAELGHLTVKLFESGFGDYILYDHPTFERFCDVAGLDTEGKEKILSSSRYLCIRFSASRTLKIPRNLALPFLERNDINKYGSFGKIYSVKLPSGQLEASSGDIFLAEKLIRPLSHRSSDDWKRIFREVRTLQERRDHPNINPLLASDGDLADWLTCDHVPSNVKHFSQENRRKFIYRSIYALVSCITYLHKEINGEATAHHDLKPRNILVIGDKFMLADFGNSHLRSILKGSATGGVSGLGTYEYQPPEYWEDDGSEAQISHGRAFDVWGMACIIIELVTLIVYDWQSQRVSNFRDKRSKNNNKNRASPPSSQGGSDFSFHNNMAVVDDWIDQLKCDGRCQKLDEVMDITKFMLAFDPDDRLYIWEAQMDLYKTLKASDSSIQDLTDDLCAPPSFAGSVWWTDFEYQYSYNPHPSNRRGDSPLHRAARSSDRARIIRLWELGWPLDSEYVPRERPTFRETARQIIRNSESVEVRELENNVQSMLDSARAGRVEDVKGALDEGLSPLMRGPYGRSALRQAVLCSQIELVDLLLLQSPESQIIWQDGRELLIETAASIGSVETLERLVRHYPVKSKERHFSQALVQAARFSHLDNVELLLTNGASVLPRAGETKGSTPIHFALSDSKPDVVYEIVKLLLKAENSHKCLELPFLWNQMTPLLLAANAGHLRCFTLLRQHGASLHAQCANFENVLHTLAQNGNHEILQLCIAEFSLEELNGGESKLKPLEIARQKGHNEVFKLLKTHIQGLERASGLGVSERVLNSFSRWSDRLLGPKVAVRDL
ncbi:MAG: hypothetical protein M1814_006160 [Vezdaea aestivalis]|nr:MAG: hypothetical protein M1814_006160 [Vezdaea aestivalis]